MEHRLNTDEEVFSFQPTAAGVNARVFRMGAGPYPCLDCRRKVLARLNPSVGVGEAGWRYRTEGFEEDMLPGAQCVPRFTPGCNVDGLSALFGLRRVELERKWMAFAGREEADSRQNKNLSAEIAKWVPDAYSPARKMGRRGELERFETDKSPAGFVKLKLCCLKINEVNHEENQNI